MVKEGIHYEKKTKKRVTSYLVVMAVFLGLGATPVIGAEKGEETLTGSQESVFAKTEVVELPATVALKVQGTWDKTGKLSVTVSDKEISDAVKQVKDTELKGVAIELQVQKGEHRDEYVEVTFSEKAMELLRAENVMALDIQTTDRSLNLNGEALKSLPSGAMVISLIPVDFNTFSKEAQQAVGQRPLLRVKISCNDKVVTDLGQGKADLRISYTLSQGEREEGVGAVFVDDKATLTWIEEFAYDTRLGEVSLSVGTLGIYGIGYQEEKHTFMDIANHEAKEDIDFVVARGILGGVDVNNFAPEQHMTRGTFIAALGRMDGIDAKSQNAPSFTDVAITADYAPYVAWATEAGVVCGTGSNLFLPDAPIRAEEVAVILDNYARVKGLEMPLKKEEVSFSDEEQIASWAKAAVKKMQLAGVIGDDGQGEFQPKALTTKAEVASMLRRFLEPTKA